MRKSQEILECHYSVFPTVYKPIVRMYNLFILSVEPAFKSKDVAVVFVIATLTVDSLIGLVWVTNAE